ncbi:hypothetical protein [Novosphingobium sp.]|uniref:hypothetical protein n=1 Tax=Novosphingobium sp. TaxID=1874826 RepID=UPI0035ADDAB5
MTVLIPTLCAALYYGLLASDVYVSQAKFVVRSPEKPTGTGLGVLLKSAGFTNAGDEIYAAKEFVASRDALQSLDKDGTVRKAYGSPAVSLFDRFDPLGLDGSFEALYRYYSKKVAIEHDSASSVTTLTVRAYTPREAQMLNERLLEMAEATVNRLNERGRQDLIRYAQREVDEAQSASRAAALALSAYRNQQGVVDPEKQAAVQLQMISKLQDELISTKTELVQLQQFAPRNPQLEVLRTRVRSLGTQIDEELGKVAGGRKSLSSTAAQYQRLVVESQFADKQLAGAMSSLEEARNEARRKQAYVERIVQPNLPDEALEPRRLRSILASIIVGLALWGVLSMLLSSIKEHVD